MPIQEILNWEATEIMRDVGKNTRLPMSQPIRDTHWFLWLEDCVTKNPQGVNVN